MNLSDCSVPLSGLCVAWTKKLCPVNVECEAQLLGQDPEEIGVHAWDEFAVEHRQRSDAKGRDGKMAASHWIVGAAVRAAGLAGTFVSGGARGWIEWIIRRPDVHRFCTRPTQTEYRFYYFVPWKSNQLRVFFQSCLASSICHLLYLSGDMWYKRNFTSVSIIFEIGHS